MSLPKTERENPHNQSPKQQTLQDHTGSSVWLPCSQFLSPQQASSTMRSQFLVLYPL
jgi:hypothetical protein